MEFRRIPSGSHYPTNFCSSSTANSSIAGMWNNVLVAGLCNLRSGGALMNISNFMYSKPCSTLSLSTSKTCSVRRHAFPLMVMEWPPRRSTFELVCRACDTETTTSEASPKLYRNREDLHKLLELLPEEMRRKLLVHGELEHLVEIVLDLGRRPLARFPSGDWFISRDVVSSADLGHAVSLVGEFADDNRAGMDRTLHRISAIRNRAGGIIGLTCRTGRAISGSAEMARDLVAGGGSLLLMGPPGVGKTTAIREVARMLADEYYKRVVVVDTSNEIAGDGDIPHPGIGRARRMQVPEVLMQHEIMIEAVENHMPQTIVIDEIGTELEAFAAGTIAQRGVQLVGTAHGMTVENLIKNPSLNSLAGGIQSVILGDEEARRRGMQKSILERKGPPTFTAAVEMVSRNVWHVHHSLAATVDALLAGREPQVEVRTMTDTGQVIVGSKGMTEEPQKIIGHGSQFTEDRIGDEDSDSEDEDDEEDEEYNAAGERYAKSQQRWGNGGPPLVLYTYQVTETSLKQVLEVMGLEERVQLTDDIGIADAVLALRSKLKSSAWVRGMAKYRQLPVFAIKANTMAQMVRAMRTIFQMESLAPSAALLTSNQLEIKSNYADSTGFQDVNRKLTSEDKIDALEEARLAIEQFVIPYGQPVELLPRTSEIMALQIKLVEGYQLQTEQAGTNGASRLRILPSPVLSSNGSSDEKMSKKSSSGPDVSTQSGTSVSRLPVLPA
ncbi:unnamed protein product [Calypogeia fissa]